MVITLFLIVSALYTGCRKQEPVIIQNNVNTTIDKIPDEAGVPVLHEEETIENYEYLAEEIPQVIGKTIRFANYVQGQLVDVVRVQMGDHDRYHIFPKQGRLVHVSEHLIPNMGQYRIDFYTFKGGRIAQSDILTGEFNFLFLENTGRVLAGQIAGLVEANNSYLFDLDGNLINVLIHDFDTRQIGITEDEKYIWYVATTPYNHVMVFDAHTGIFLFDHSTDEAHFNFMVEGKYYSIVFSLDNIPDIENNEYLFIADTLVSQEMPQVIDKTIRFANNVRVQLGDRDRYHIFPNQGRLVHVSDHLIPNMSQYRIDFYNFRGTRIAQSDILIGEFNFIFLENTGRVLAGQIATLVEANDSYLFDLDGNLINVLIHDFEAKQIGITEDEKYIWYVANKRRPLNPGERPIYTGMTTAPYNHVMVFDARTGFFLFDHSTDETYFNFVVEGKSYSIVFSPPSI